MVSVPAMRRGVVAVEEDRDQTKGGWDGAAEGKEG